MYDQFRRIGRIDSNQATREIAMPKRARQRRKNRSVAKVVEPLQVEAGLLGAILEDNEQACRVQHCLKAQNFRHPIYRWTYEAVFEIIESGEVASPLTLAVIAAADGVLDDCGGIEFFDSLLDQIPEKRDLEGWAEAIRFRKPWQEQSPAPRKNCTDTGWD